MSDLLRSLHPADEAARYAPVWHGAKWRDYDFTPAPLLPLRRAPATVREAVEAALTDEPMSVSKMAGVLNLSYFVAQGHLTALVTDQQAIRTRRSVKGRRGHWRSIVRYARSK